MEVRTGINSGRDDRRLSPAKYRPMDKRMLCGHPLIHSPYDDDSLPDARERRPTHLIRPNSVVLTAGSTLKAAQSYSRQRADIRTLDSVYRSLFHPHLGPPRARRLFAIFDCFRLIVRAGRQVHQMLG